MWFFTEIKITECTYLIIIDRYLPTSYLDVIYNIPIHCKFHHHAYYSRVPTLQNVFLSCLCCLTLIPTIDMVINEMDPFYHIVATLEVTSTFVVQLVDKRVGILAWYFNALSNFD